MNDKQNTVLFPHFHPAKLLLSDPQWKRIHTFDFSRFKHRRQTNVFLADFASVL